PDGAARDRQAGQAVAELRDEARVGHAGSDAQPAVLGRPPRQLPDPREVEDLRRARAVEVELDHQVGPPRDRPRRGVLGLEGERLVPRVGLEDLHRRRSRAQAVAPVVCRARSSMWVRSAEWSQSPRPFARRAWSIWSTAAVFGSATPYSRAVSSAIPRSLWCRSIRKPGVKSCSRKLRPRTSITLFAARPPESTSTIVAGSTPALEPRTRASETASIVSPTTTWLHALT